MCSRLLTTFQLFHRYKSWVICCGAYGDGQWLSGAAGFVSWQRGERFRRSWNPEHWSAGSQQGPPLPFGDTTQERLLLEEEGSFQGPVPGAQRGQRGFVVGDFHGNRLRGAAKVKREAGEQKMPGRGSRRSWWKLFQGLVQGLGGARGLGLLARYPTRGTQKAVRRALVVLRGGRWLQVHVDMQSCKRGDSASGWNLRSQPCLRPAAVVPKSLREPVSGVSSLLWGCLGGKFQLFSGEKKCPLAQNFHVKGKSAPCISGS